MPYLKQAEAEELTLILRGYNLNGNNLQPVLNQSQATIRNKINNPDLLTVGDLRKIAKFKHIPIEKLRAGIKI